MHIPDSKSLHSTYKKRIWKKNTILSFLSLIIVLSLIVPSFSINTSTLPFHRRKHHHNKKRNVIFFVTDGMGPASLSMSRSFRQKINNLPIDDILTLDKHLIGSSRTRSSDSLVTDSAAGATAFSCALKTYNGAIGVDSDKNPCGTILEAAKLDGYLTGLVVTTRITDATPASFSAHVDYRFQEDLIADQQLGNYPLGRMVDLLMGGGRTHFLPNGVNGGSRSDNRNLIDEAKGKGWSYVGNRNDFDSLQLGKNVSLPLLALLANTDIPFDFDRNPKEYPSIKEQAITAVTALSEASKDSEKGFFLMIEGSRIDHAGHQNDPASQVREVLAFDEAFNAVLEFVKNSDTETIIISTSDHETGGLVVSRQVTKSYPDYVWFPEILQNSYHSGEYLKSVLTNFKNSNDKLTENQVKDFIKKELFENGINVKDYTDDDVNEIFNCNNENDVQEKLNQMISFRAQIGWTTHGHSAVDVNIYAYSNKKNTFMKILDKLQGNHENIEIGKFLSSYLNLNLTKVTQMIQDTIHHPDMKAKMTDHYTDEYHHRIKVSDM